MPPTRSSPIALLLLLLFLVAGLVGLGAPAAADSLLWRQETDSYTSFKSVRSSEEDREAADDFVLDGTVTRLVIRGGQGHPPPPEVPVEAVEVRFYAVAGDGRPGTVLAEYLLTPGDPDLIVDPVRPSTVEVTLSPPFSATGRHFVGVQVVTDSRWNVSSADTPPDSATRGSVVWSRDHLAGGGWEPYSNALGTTRSDMAFELYGEPTAAPTLTAVTPVQTTPSGRLRIAGRNLGGTPDGGSVTIGGLPAPVAEWTDREIHAYVPEGLDGPADVVVANTVGPGAPRPVSVVPRTAQGQVEWRFTCDGQYVWHRVGLGPDGTVYAQDTKAIVYAIAPGGGLRWLRDLGEPGTDGEGAEGPVAVGDDGAIFVGVNPAGPASRIVALEPDGSTRWVYTHDDTQGLMAGPGVGPGGHVYAAFDLPNPAVVSLDATDGSLRWSRPGDPVVSQIGQLGQEIGFGSDRFYLAFDGATSTTARLYGFTYDGEQLFAVGQPTGTAYPTVGPDGNVYSPYFLSSTGTRLASYDPDGNLRWVVFESPTQFVSNVGIAPDGTIHTVRNISDLVALEPTGAVRWRTDAGDMLQRPVVSPSGDLLITGAVAESSDRGLFRAFDDAGEPVWSQELPYDPDGAILIPTPTAGVRFSSDGSTAYGPVHRNRNDEIDEHCYVYALATEDRSGGGGDGDPGDGDQDSVIFIDGFESGDGRVWSLMTP